MKEDSNSYSMMLGTVADFLRYGRKERKTYRKKLKEVLRDNTYTPRPYVRFGTNLL